MKKIKHTILSSMKLFLAVAGVFLFIFQTPAYALPYGSGDYSGCDYGCSEGVTTTDVPDAPEQTTASIELNVADGDVIRVDNFLIKAKIYLTDSNNNAVLLEDGRVAFYIDSKLLSTDYTPDSQGFFTANWPVAELNGTKISVLAYDSSDELLARKDVFVVVDLPEPVVVASPDKSSGIFALFAKMLRNFKAILGQVSPAVAKSFPYWLFLILLIMAIRLIWQAIQEATYKKRYDVILENEKLIAQEKDNFIYLSSHYLNTPFSIMNSGLESLLSQSNNMSLPNIESLKKSLSNLKTNIDSILQTIESNSRLNSIPKPDLLTPQKGILKTGHFWFPVGVVAGLSSLSNYLLGVVGEIDLGSTNLLAQAVVFSLIMVFLYGAIRTHNLRQTDRVNTEQLLHYEEIVDSARNQLIRDADDRLTQDLFEINKVIQTVSQNGVDVKYIQDGYNRFNSMLVKFRMLGEVEAGKTSSSQMFNIKETVNNTLNKYKDLIEAKKLIINQKITDINIDQNYRFFGFVLGSIIENAIKFSKEGGSIDIVANDDHGKAQISVQDSGVGIPEEKLPHLFSPFSKAGSVLQFDSEGLGFSLYLDKIIVDYLGGDIQVMSEKDKGTLVTFTA